MTEKECVKESYLALDNEQHCAATSAIAEFLLQMAISDDSIHSKFEDRRTIHSSVMTYFAS